MRQKAIHVGGSLAVLAFGLGLVWIGAQGMAWVASIAARAALMLGG